MKTIFLILLITGITFSECNNSDLTPTITLSPSSFVVPSTNHSRSLRMYVRISEILDFPTNGVITLKIEKDSRFTFSFNQTLTNLGSTVLQNSIWTFDDTDPMYWVWSTSNIINGLNSSTFGVQGVFNTEGTSGTKVFTVILEPGSGGEVNITNNSNSEQIDYFTNQ